MKINFYSMNSIKKIMIWGVLMLIFSSALVAQQDPQARVILDAMSRTYQKIPSFTAAIAYSMVNETEEIDESYAGKISVKGDMYRLVMDEQEVINDGETVWTYLPDANEVNIDFHDAEAGDITPSTIYDIYKDGYKYLLINQVTIDGQQYNVVDLVPDSKDAQYFKIRLQIAKSSNLLRQFTMFDKEGSEYSYLISEFDGDVNLPDEYFKFDISEYEDVEVIDLR